MSIIDSHIAALLLLLLQLLLLLPILQGWPPSNFSRSALIDSLVCSINSSRRVNEDLGSMLRYVHWWLSNCCSSPASLPAPARLTTFVLLQINSNWLTGRLHWFRTCSTLRWFNDGGIYAILTRQRGRTEIQRYLILSSCNELHALSFWAFALTCASRDSVKPHDWVDPQGRVVSYHLTYLRSFSWIAFECCQRCGRVLMMGFLPSSSSVSPHGPPVLPPWDCSLVGVCAGP